MAIEVIVGCDYTVVAVLLVYLSYFTNLPRFLVELQLVSWVAPQCREVNFLVQLVEPMPVLFVLVTFCSIDGPRPLTMP